jgi:hypothetical protein
VNPEDRCAKWGYTIADLYAFMSEHGYLHRYEVRVSDNSVYQMEYDEQVVGDVLFVRTAFPLV